MDTPFLLLIVVLTTALVQVQCSGTCSSQYPIIPGPPGPPGPPGRDGRDGRDGHSGRDGRDGIHGVPTQTGDKCDQSDIGSRGNPGSTNLTEGDLNCCDNITAKLLDISLTGSKGDRGDIGPTGTKGDQGDIGPTGPKGDRGEIGPKGSKGDRGDIGPTGLKGDRGDTTELLETIQTLNQTLTDRLLHLESQVFVTVCNITSANWRRIAYFDTTQGDSCPTGLRTVTNTTTNQTACGRTANPGCTSLQFSPDGSYTNVCGRVRGYQDTSSDAFYTGTDSIDSYYIDGISITRGSPRTHLWSYAAGSCPCETSDPPNRSVAPSFVGEDFYCETGFPVGSYENRIAWENPLWDGQGCTSSGNQCCNRYGWFHRGIPTTSDNIEVRWCSNQSQSNEDVFTDQLEIWVM